jgi:hypothetical protein
MLFACYFLSPEKSHDVSRPRPLRSVIAPEGPINPIDTYNLAQTRLKGLRAN